MIQSVIDLDCYNVEPGLHDINVPLTKRDSASSSRKPLLLEPITPAPIPPSKTQAATPSQSQTIKHLLFEDDKPLQSSTTNIAAKPQKIIPLLDPTASTMSKGDDPPKKHHCPSKSHDD
ncbi:hypothetical protein SADUNF_Sadunf16G0197000 [Salix dunnii]|uniref:Uncharacterized protein n=1 Tax=Salix dunnii TaxID=1413687 RepID=A0A835JAM8_9ROSI|nr:hypothetical protein SADUNF_Sadunf16G0197000 [Salix dunnii]